MLPPRMAEAVPKRESVLLVWLTDGAERLFDVKPYLQSDLIRSLGDDACLRQVRVAGGTISWPEGQDFDRSTPYFASVPIESQSV